MAGENRGVGRSSDARIDLADIDCLIFGLFPSRDEEIDRGCASVALLIEPLSRYDSLTVQLL